MAVLVAMVAMEELDAAAAVAVQGQQVGRVVVVAMAL